MNSRLSGAILAMQEAVAAASNLPLESIGPDEDLIEDLALDTLELVSLGLIIEEVFSIAVPDELWESPLYRTPAAMAEWAIRQSDGAAWAESKGGRRANG